MEINTPITLTAPLWKWIIIAMLEYAGIFIVVTGWAVIFKNIYKHIRRKL